ncbi:MAG TPA: hypothetical protein VE995_08530 [Gaiellaceae bacterium]|nr:hypothetical protein [Gaiellaceae bacterium]
MRRILLSVVGAVLLALPGAASAGSGRATYGFLVVRDAAGDGGRPVLVVVVQGFVLGSVTQEARVDVYQLPSSAGEGGPQAAGPDVSRRSVRWRRFTGTEYSGSGFRFRAIGGAYRVVVRGSGVYLFAGGRGSAILRGSSLYPARDGEYSFSGAPFRSLPARPLTHAIGAG